MARDDDDEKVSPELAFSRILSSDDWVSDKSTLFEWRQSHWAPLQIEEVERKAWRFLTLHYPLLAKPAIARSCAAAAIMSAPALPNRSEGVLIPSKNGTLAIYEQDGEWIAKLREPRREDGLTYCLSCDYHQDALAREFESFLISILPDREIRDYVQDYVGYSLLSDCRFQRAQWWIGKGSDGKSTLAEIIASLHQKVAALPLGRLDDAQLIGLLGASLVCVAETPRRIDEQRIKTLISGEPIQIDRKYRDALSLRPMAKWIICGNQLPHISDQTAGFWRRFDIIPFGLALPDEEQDPLLASRIIKNELDGVLSWCVRGLIRVLARGRLAPKPAAVAGAIDSGRRETNSVMSWWLDEDWAIADRHNYLKSEVYSAYQLWCKNNGMSAVAMPRFWRRLGEIAPGISEERRSEAGKRERFVNVCK